MHAPTITDRGRPATVQQCLWYSQALPGRPRSPARGAYGDRRAGAWPLGRGRGGAEDARYPVVTLEAQCAKNRSALAKNYFQVHALASEGSPAVKRKLTLEDAPVLFANRAQLYRHGSLRLGALLGTKTQLVRFKRALPTGTYAVI